MDPEDVNGTCGIDCNKPVVIHEIQSFHDAHEEARGDDGRNDRHEDVAEGLDKALEGACLGRRRGLGLLLRRRADAARSQERIVNFVYNAGSKDDLQLSLRFKHPFYAVNVLKPFFADLAVVRDDQTEPRRAVRGGNDVARAAGLPEQLGCNFLIIHTDTSLDRLFCIVESVSYYSFIIGFKFHLLKRHI